MNIADLMLTLIAEIQEEANRIAEASRSETTDGESRTIVFSEPNLNLERLIQQAQADAEIAGYCTTDKSRKVRRAALVRAGACSLLALFEMDREKMQKLREAMSKCPECVPLGPDPSGSEIDACLHTHGLGFMADGPPMAPDPDGLLVSHVPEPEHPRDCGCRSCSGSY